MYSKIFFFLILISFTFLDAADLTSPFTFDNAQVLPSGVRNFRFFNFYMTMQNRFDRTGTGRIGMGDRLNKPVTWNDIYQQSDDPLQKKLIQSLVSDNNIPETGIAGSATGEVNTFVDVKVPTFAISLSPKFTLAVAVPILKVDVSVDTGFVRSVDGQKMVTAACEASPEKCNEAARKLNNGTSQKLNRLGYQPLSSQTVSGIGDIQLFGKYQVYNISQRSLTSRIGVTLPTGSRLDPDKALDITTGDGRFKVGATMLYDHAILPESTWNVFGGYTALLPNNLVRRLPTSPSDSLSADKEFLTQNLGHLVALGTSLDYRFASLGLRVGAGYSFQFLSQSHYTGTSASPAIQSRIALLDDLEPAETLHSITATFGFSTVQWYLQKAFFLPFELNVAYSQPIAGRNSPMASLFAGEAVFFF